MGITERTRRNGRGQGRGRRPFPPSRPFWGTSVPASPSGANEITRSVRNVRKPMRSILLSYFFVPSWLRVKLKNDASRWVWNAPLHSARTRGTVDECLTPSGLLRFATQSISPSGSVVPTRSRSSMHGIRPTPPLVANPLLAQARTPMPHYAAAPSNAPSDTPVSAVTKPSGGIYSAEASVLLPRLSFFRVTNALCRPTNASCRRTSAFCRVASASCRVTNAFCRVTSAFCRLTRPSCCTTRDLRLADTSVFRFPFPPALPLFIINQN